MEISQLITLTRNHWRPILLVHVLFTLLSITLLAPLFGALLQGLLSLSGSSAVADQDIALLLLSPAGMIAAVCLVALFLAIAGLELAALQTIAQAAYQGLQVTALEATSYALRNALRILRLTLRFTLRVLVYLIPYLLALGLVAWFLLLDHDINYYLAEQIGRASCRERV